MISIKRCLGIRRLAILKTTQRVDFGSDLYVTSLYDLLNLEVQVCLTRTACISGKPDLTSGLHVGTAGEWQRVRHKYLAIGSFVTV